MSSMRARRWWWCALALCAPLAADEPEVWWERMQQAQSSLSYHGVLIVDGGQGWESLELRQWVEAGKARQRLISLNGAPREVVRGEQGVASVDAVSDTRLAAPLAANPGASTLAALAPWYAVAAKGTDRVAGRPVQRLDLDARDALRYGWRLWLDRDSGLVLRSERVAADGSVVERQMYAFVAIDGSDSKPLAAADSPVNPDQPEAEPGPPALPGFAWRLRAQAIGPTGTEHWLMSDGLAYVSIYWQPESGPTRQSLQRFGALSRLSASSERGRWIMVGDVPPQALQNLLAGWQAHVAAAQGAAPR